MQQVSQGAPSFCVSMHIIICISVYVCVCVNVYMHLFVDACRTSNKNVSHVFCWKGWASIRQTQPSGCWIWQVLTVLQMILLAHPWLSGPPPSLSTHTGPGLLRPQHRLLHSTRRTIFCQVASNQCMRKHSQTLLNQPCLWGGQRYFLQLRVRERLGYMW